MKALNYIKQFDFSLELSLSLIFMIIKCHPVINIADNYFFKMFQW